MHPLSLTLTGSPHCRHTGFQHHPLSCCCGFQKDHMYKHAAGFRLSSLPSAFPAGHTGIHSCRFLLPFPCASLLHGSGFLPCHRHTGSCPAPLCCPGEPVPEAFPFHHRNIPFPHRLERPSLTEIRCHHTHRKWPVLPESASPVL